MQRKLEEGSGVRICYLGFQMRRVFITLVFIPRFFFYQVGWAQGPLASFKRPNKNPKSVFEPDYRITP
ncbi:hypothetical protein HanXRQr2_Chr15g0703001 [Helianthus annuus]|uniref:Uncharacterized protein n=1 Tax=Helianthus annuus TaxID=4232 RepID=A0A9K3H2V7_HELAN|nr:hypothetical protein HanXRQr2_Chr15g0703001 [Helianthus annuus]